jgi:hypothetical protein
VREPYSLDHFEWDVSAGIAFPGAYGDTDFSNRGERGIEKQIERNRQLGLQRASTVETTDRFLYLNAGLWGQLGNFGVTVTGDSLNYDVANPNETTPSLDVNITRFHLVAAYAFLNNQLCVGAGARVAYVGISERDNPDASVISMIGVAPQVGLILKPEDRSFRVGITARAGVSASPFRGITNLIHEEQTDGTTIERAGSFILPRRVVQPWEVEAGVAYQLGPRPLNPRWIDPHGHQAALLADIAERRKARATFRSVEIASMPTATPVDRAARLRKIAEAASEEAALRAEEDAEIRDRDAILQEERRARYANWPREHVLLLASVLMTGPSTDAVALEGFIDQQRELVGARATLAPKFGIEAEAVPNLLKTRAGIYVEPSRFVDGTARQHFTTGFDVRIFAWDVLGLFPGAEWRVSAFLDVAERYQNFGFGVGSWH